MRLEKNLNKLDIIDKFFIIWSFFIPITSFVLMPSVKGSLISYILAFITPFIILFRVKNFFKKYIMQFLFFLFIWISFFCLSQLGNLIWHINLTNLILVSTENIDYKLFRNSLYTQSLYLLPCIMTYLYCKNFYKPIWDKWISYSGFIFVIIGLLKFFIYFFTNGSTDGDFLTNREYGEGGTNSLFQYINILGLSLVRIQSLTGEPSMYSFIVLPYLIFFFYKNEYWKAFITIISIILSFSSTGFIGLFIYFLLYIIYNKKKNYKIVVVMFIPCIILYYLFFEYIGDILNFTFFDKMSSGSGIERSGNIYDNLLYWYDLDFWHMLVGIGFGYIRSTDLFTTLLVNIGAIGLFLWIIFTLKNFKIRLRKENDFYTNAILLLMFITSMISVPEFSFLSMWMFLGIIGSDFYKNRSE